MSTTTLSRPSIPSRSKSDFGSSSTTLLPNPLPSPEEEPAFASQLSRSRGLPTSPTLDLNLLSFPLPPRPVSFLRSNSNLSTTSHASATSPFPVSAFSDYGSTPACSTVNHTPWGEYDRLDFDDEYEHEQGSGYTENGQERGEGNAGDYFSIPSTMSDDYRSFARAIQKAEYEFVLPSFPPKRLVERRPNFGKATEATAATGTGNGCENIMERRKEGERRTSVLVGGFEEEKERYAQPASFGTTAGGGRAASPITPPTDGDEAEFMRNGATYRAREEITLMGGGYMNA